MGDPFGFAGRLRRAPQAPTFPLTRNFPENTLVATIHLAALPLSRLHWRASTPFAAGDPEFGFGSCPCGPSSAMPGVLVGGVGGA